MSDESDEPQIGPTHPTVPVTVSIPEGMLRDYDGDVERGLYADREAALLDALVEGWRHHQGRYSTLRVDIGLAGEKKARPDTDDVDLEEAASAAEALKDNEG
jgi:Arc/MetJ-type ribon-helix-helix transcriptional regulator